MATTKSKTIRVPDDLWDKAGQRAAAEGTTRAALINGWLEDYVDEDKTVTTELASVMSQLKAIRTRLVPDGDISE